MARPRKKKARREKSRRVSSARESGADGAAEGAALQFSRVNAIFAALGVLALIAGYWLLAQGSITAAPILLVVGYVVLLPLAVIL